MKIGPTLYKECPSCLRVYKQWTIASGNTIGARYWSDGKVKTPMYRSTSWLVKCPECEAFHWIDEAQTIGKEPLGVRPRGHRQPGLIGSGAKYYTKPNEADLLLAIREGVGSTAQQLRYLRVQAWWALNDPCRGGWFDCVPSRTPASPPTACWESEQNLIALADSLNEYQPDERIMKAELKRELSLFSEAMRLLSYEFEQKYRPTVETLGHLVRQKATKVEKLPSAPFDPLLLRR